MSGENENEDMAGATVEKKVRTPKLTPEGQLFGPNDYSEFKHTDRNNSMLKGPNKPLKIETVVSEQKLSEDASAEQTLEYEEVTGSKDAFLMNRKKKIVVPLYALMRHRKKPRSGKDFKDKTYFNLSHVQAAELRKAPTHMKEGAPVDAKFDWMYKELTPGCVWALEIPVNLNEGLKIAGPDGKAISAPEEWRYFPRMFISRLVSQDAPGENEQEIEVGEMLYVPASVQMQWLEDDSIDRGSSIDRIFSKDTLATTFRIPIKFDIKEWVDAIKEDGKKARVSNADSDEKKEKKAVKRKLEPKATEPKSSKTPEAKASDVKMSSAKRAKADSTSTVPPADKTAVALMLEEARKTGGTLVMTSTTYRIE